MFDSGFAQELEQFEDMLTERTDEGVHGFLQVCQKELDARTQRELEIAKNALAKCSKDQLLSVLLHLGIELPAADKKPRERKNPLLYGYKKFGEYFVPKFFNPTTNEHCVGSQAVFLAGLSTEEKLQRFGTVQQLETGAINLAQLVELNLVYMLIDGACVQATLDMLPVLETAQEIAGAAITKSSKKTKRQEPEVADQQA